MLATDSRVAPPARTAPARRPRIIGPSAWIGAEMKKRKAEWTYRLSSVEIAEIEAAGKAVRARGLDIAEIRRADFPLPTLGPVFDRLRAEVLDGRGFVLLRFPGAPSAAALQQAAGARDVPLRVIELAEPAAAALYERKLVLVRPDGHVAWRADAVPEDALALIDRVRGAAA